MEEDILEAKSVETEVLSPEQFLKLKPEEKSSIADVRIVAPKLGSRHFGGVEVRYKTPVYKVM